MATNSTRTQLTLHNSVLDPLRPYIPERKSLTQFVEDCLEQHRFTLDGSDTLIKPSEREVLSSSNKEEEERACALSVDDQPTQAKRRELDPSLEHLRPLILDFWRVKGGSKGDRPWQLLQTGLKAIQERYGEDVARQQLEEGINAKWQGISLARFEQFNPNAKKVTKPKGKKWASDEEWENWMKANHPRWAE
nr:hypothetical protein [uncultured Mediterranean phage uvMED]